MNIVNRLTVTCMLLIATVGQSASAAEIKCVDGQAGGYSCNDVDLKGRMARSDFALTPALITDVWGYIDLNDNTEYAIVGLYNGVSVVNVTDAENPVEVASIAGGNSGHRDIKVYQYFDEAAQRYKAYAYVSSDLPEGIQILDLNDLANALPAVGNFLDGGFAHNVFISNVDHSSGMTLPGFDAYLHLPISPTSTRENLVAFDISSLTDPTSPEFITGVGSTDGHDIVSFTVTDARASQCQPGHDPCEIIVNFSGWDRVVELWDVTDKQAPTLLSSMNYTESSYPHSGWISADSMYIFAQDEGDELNFNVNTTMRTIDISDLANPFVSNVWRGPTEAIDHNGMTLEQHYFMSNYTRGLTILEVSDSNDPQAIAYFDTYPETDNAGYQGAWGVYPYLPSGSILVSDSSNGLFILSMNPDAVIDPAVDNSDAATTSTPGANSNKNSGGSLFYLLLITAWALIARRHRG